MSLLPKFSGFNIFTKISPNSISSSALIASSNDENVNHLAGGPGDDEFNGSSKDFINYNLEDAYSENGVPSSGINADLTSGIIFDTYGNTDRININNTNKITNIIGSKLFLDNNPDSDTDIILYHGWSFGVSIIPKFC